MIDLGVSEVTELPIKRNISSQQSRKKGKKSLYSGKSRRKSPIQANKAPSDFNMDFLQAEPMPDRKLLSITRQKIDDIVNNRNPAKLSKIDFLKVISSTKQKVESKMIIEMSPEKFQTKTNKLPARNMLLE